MKTKVISRTEFILGLKKQDIKDWYFHEVVLEAAEEIALKKGFKITYYEFSLKGEVIALIPFRFKYRRLFFKYGELLLSKELGIDNFNLMANWEHCGDTIISSLRRLFTKVSLNVLLDQDYFERQAINSRQILIMKINGRELFYSKNFKQGIRTAKNRASNLSDVDYKLVTSNEIGFANTLYEFSVNHYQTKVNSKWNYGFYKAIINQISPQNHDQLPTFLILELYLEKKLVASIFGWIAKDTFYFNQSFYNESAKFYSPIILLIEKCCNILEKDFLVNYFDFMRGNEKYKLRFTSSYYKVFNLELTSSTYDFLQVTKSIIAKLKD